MSALDKFYDFTLNLPDAKLTSKAMSLCNIDRNVFNIYLTLQEGKNNPILNADLGNYTVTMIVVKPKTKEYVEKVGVVDGSNDRLLFELGDTFNDQIGSYKGEIKVQNGNEVITSSSFAYTVTQSLISGLNAEIEASPDVEILRQLINEVKAVVGMTPGDPDSLLTDYQKKNDNTLITTDKTIIGAINENSLQIKDIAKDVLLEDGKLYLKKSDGAKLGAGVMLPLSGGGGNVTWESLTGKPTTFTPSSHSHSKSDITDFPAIPTKTSELNNDSGFLTSHQDLSNYVQKETGKGLSTNDLTTILKQNYDNAYTHSQSTHAPANAQKNSDITKEEIEEKLTGEISSHSHANSSVTGSEFKKVIETTFGEDCYAFTVTQDKDGNPLQLKEGIICVTASQPKNTETQISFGVGFLDWESSYNGKSSIYNVALMKNYEFYRLHVYFKIINNKVLAINLGTIRMGTVAPSFNNFDSVTSVTKVDMSSFRALQNNYIDKIVIGLDMANTGLISGDSILEVWSI